MSMDTSDSIDNVEEKKYSYERWSGHYLPISILFLFTIWLRCPIQDDNGVDGILLDYGRYFLPYFGIILYIIYFIEKSI